LLPHRPESTFSCTLADSDFGIIPL